jgi:peptidyl-prolyl cis-trans isomerase D
MLEKVRNPKRAKNIIAYIIFGAICSVFIFMGDIPSQFGMTSAGGPAAIVNKEPISFADYREMYSRLESQYRGQLDFLPAQQKQMYLDNLRTEALELLINNQLVSQKALELGFLVADEEVRDYILKIPAFKEEDRFRRERYDNYLNFRKISPEKFETEIRKEVANTQMRQLLATSLTPSQTAINTIAKAESSKANLEIVRISEDNLKEGLIATQEQIDKFLADEATAKSVKDFYDANKTRFELEEKVRAKHILVRFDSSKAGDKEASLKKIKELKLKAEKEDFSKLAKEFSEDPGSKEKGGDLDFFGRGAMVPEFEKAAFSGELNKVSEPVETQFGYHLILPIEKQSAKVQTFEEVKQEIAKELIVENLIKLAVEDLNNVLTVDKSTNLDNWLKQKKLKWEETGEFSLSTSTVPKLPIKEEDLGYVLKQMSSGKTLMDKPFQVGKTYYLVKVKKFLPFKSDTELKSKDELETIRDQVVSDVFGQWAKVVKEASIIERNNQILMR